jgi:hypothetical protein
MNMNDDANIVLKTIHNDIMKSNANATLTTKQMRVWLRANMRDINERNKTWMFTQSQYDVVRSQFDVAYREKLKRDEKRNAKTNAKTNATQRNAKTKTAQRNAKTNDVVNVVNVNENA